MNFAHIDHGNTFDFGKTAEMYAQYRDIYPTELYTRLHEIGVGRKGERWLDLGTGTGVLPKNMAHYGADITGVDISPEQIAYARAYAREHNLPIRYLTCDVRELELPSHSFDSITAAQCFWYFDRETVLPMIRRLLKPGGIFVKIYLTYLLEDEVAARSHELVRTINPAWTPAASGSKDMYDDCFPNRVTEKTDCTLTFTRESWHGRMTACRGTLASMDAETFAEWETASRALLAEYPQTFTVKHRLIISRFRMD